MKMFANSPYSSVEMRLIEVESDSSGFDTEKLEFKRWGSIIGIIRNGNLDSILLNEEREIRQIFIIFSNSVGGT